MKKFSVCMKALWAMGAPVRWRMAVTVVIGLVRIAASLGFVWASKYLVDIATGVQKADITTGIILFLSVLLLQLVTVVLGNWWNAYNHVKAQNLLRKDIFGHIMRSRWDGRERFLSGDAVNRLEEDTRVVAELLVDRIPGMAVTLLGLIASGVYLLILAPNLLWVLVILMVVTVFGSKLFFRQLRRLMSAIRAKESELQQLMQESLQHRVLVLTLTNLERVMVKLRVDRLLVLLQFVERVLCRLRRKFKNNRFHAETMGVCDTSTCSSARTTWLIVRDTPTTL